MNVSTIVTNRIIDQLEDGTIPWEKPWIGSNSAFNRVTGKPYSLFNQCLLEQPGEYATFKQWQSLGGKVKQGERAQLVIFWKLMEKKDKNKNKEDNDCDGNKTIPVLRYYPVFHISQVDDVEPLDEDKYPNTVIPDKDADGIVKNYLSREHVNFQEMKNGDRSSYSVVTDTVTVPEKEQFLDTPLYYGTVFHELIHSTGHPDRLNRISEHFTPFGSKGYAREELVAEIGSATILSMLNIETKRTQENNTAYVRSWIKALESDSRCIVFASGKAEKAVNMIMGTDVADETATL